MVPAVPCFACAPASCKGGGCEDGGLLMAACCRLPTLMVTCPGVESSIDSPVGQLGEIVKEWRLLALPCLAWPCLLSTCCSNQARAVSPLPWPEMQSYERRRLACVACVCVCVCARARACVCVCVCVSEL